MSFVVIGATFVDIKGYAKYKYIPAGRNKGYIETVHGGVVRNVAEDLANCHQDVKFVSLVDDNGTGRDVVSYLDSIGVNTDAVQEVKDGMGTWLAVFNEKGDVEASISKRPNLMPLFDSLTDDLFEYAKSAIIEIDIDEPIVKKTFEFAKKHHIDVYAVVSNMSIAKQRMQYIRSTACFVCNIQEAGILFDQNFEELNTNELIEELLNCINQYGLKKMVVTLGGKGAVYISEEECGFVPAQKVQVVDTTGAGDSFFAGVAMALSNGKTLKEASIIGTKLASTVIISKSNVCKEFYFE